MLDPEYKANRSDGGHGIDRDRQLQMLALTRLIKALPVAQIYIADCEADDVIAHLRASMRWSRAVILSSDTDMYQLLDERTSALNPATKTLVTDSDVFAKYGVLAENHGLMKAICGDRSDNIKTAVHGIGTKKATKLFGLGSMKRSLDDIYEHCAAGAGLNGQLKMLLNSFDVIQKNWALVRLDRPMLDEAQMRIVEHSFVDRPTTFDLTNLVKVIADERLQLTPEKLISAMSMLCST